MIEIWRSIKGYEGLYEVSNWGRVRNTRTGRVLRAWKSRKGYLRVNLTKDCVLKHYQVHRLVAIAFADLVDWTEDAKGRPFEELTVNHLNEDKSDNRVENLQWCPLKYNLDYGTHRERVAKTQSKTIYMCTLDNKLCGIWPSTTECSRNGFDQSAISRCCNGKLKKYKGYKWSYKPPIPPKALPYFDALPRS